MKIDVAGAFARVLMESEGKEVTVYTLGGQEFTGTTTGITPDDLVRLHDGPMETLVALSLITGVKRNAG